MAGSRFTEKGIHLDVHGTDVDLTGDIEFGSGTPLSCDIMGLSLLFPPQMCRHSVISARHTLEGNIILNGEEVAFHDSDSFGYVEGDSGRSFPRPYLWTQCLFEEGSLMVAVAGGRIWPFRFTGVIGFILLDGVEYRLATDREAKVEEIGSTGCVIRQRNMRFTARLIDSGKAPSLWIPITAEQKSRVRVMEMITTVKLPYGINIRRTKQ